MSRREWHLFGIALALIGFLFAFKDVIDLDFWWHLSAGRWMWENGAIIKQDPFSYTAQGQPWVSIPWFFEVLLYGVFRLTGGSYVAISVVISSIAALTTWISWQAFGLLRTNLAQEEDSAENGSLSFSLAAIVFLFGLFIVETRWIHRPEIFTHLCGAACIALGLAYRRTKDIRYLFILPLVQILWVNTHGIFLLGPFLVGLFYLDERAEKIASGTSQSPLFSPLFIATVAQLAVCLVNPRGWTGFTFPFHLFHVLNHPFYQRTIPEATAPLADAVWALDTWLMVIWIALLGSSTVALSWLEGPKKVFQRWGVGFWILFALLIYFSLAARRNIALMVIWTLPYAADAISRLVARGMRHLSELTDDDGIRALIQRHRWLSVGILAFAMLGLPANIVRSPRSEIRFGGDLARFRFSSGLADFYRRHKIQARTFADVETADFLLFHAPGFQPYIDGRFAEVYSQPHFQRYMDILAHPGLLEEEARRRSIEAVALSPSLPLTKGLIRFLASSPNWRLAFYDESGIVFARPDLAEAWLRDEGIARVEVKEVWAQRALEKAKESQVSSTSMIRNWNWHQKNWDRVRPLFKLAEMELLISHVHAASTTLELALRDSADNPVGLGLTCMTRFLQLAEAADRDGPSAIQPQAVSATEDICLRAKGRGESMVDQVLGLLYLNTNRSSQAVSSFESILRRDPISYEAHLMLAQALLADASSANGLQLDRIRAVLLRAADLRPYDVDPLLQLAQLLEQRNSRGEAIELYRRAQARSSDPRISKKIEELSSTSPPSRSTN